MKSILIFVCLTFSFCLFSQERDAQGREIEKNDNTFIPEFITPNGENMIVWIAKNLVVPEISSESVGCTKVIVEFSVSASGTLTDVKITSRVQEESDALRPFFLTMKTWKPALRNGKAIASKLSLPMYIKLQ
jgi:hypothetical protein